jgi:hypothetical protein
MSHRPLLPSGGNGNGPSQYRWGSLSLAPAPLAATCMRSRSIAAAIDVYARVTGPCCLREATGRIIMHGLQNVCARVSPFVVVDSILEHLYVINHIAKL